MSSRNSATKEENNETKSKPEYRQATHQKVIKKSEFQSPKPISTNQSSKNKPQTSNLSHDQDPNARRSQRAIKRKKFDDEIVDTAPVVAPPGINFKSVSVEDRCWTWNYILATLQISAVCRGGFRVAWFRLHINRVLTVRYSIL